MSSVRSCATKFILPAAAAAAATTLGTSSAAFGVLMELDVFHGSSFSSVINSTQRLRSNRFLAPSNMTVNQGHAYLNLAVGSPQLTVAVQADNGSGSPTGSDLASGTISGIGTTAGWRTIPFSGSANLTAGNVYHVIVRSPNADGSNIPFVRGTGDLVTPSRYASYTGNGTPDDNAAYGESNNAGASWSHDPNAVHIVAVSNTSNNDALGAVYSSASLANTGPNSWHGMRFTNTAATGEVESITVRLSKTGVGGAAAVNGYLIDAASNTVLGSGVIAAASTPTGEANHTLVFPGVGPSVTQGSQYIIAVESLAGASGTWSLVSNLAVTPPDDLNPLNFQGSAGSTVTASSGSFPTEWSSVDTETFFIDSFFQMDITPIPEPGMTGALACGMMTCLLHRRRSA